MTDAKQAAELVKVDHAKFHPGEFDCCPNTVCVLARFVLSTLSQPQAQVMEDVFPENGDVSRRTRLKEMFFAKALEGQQQQNVINFVFEVWAHVLESTEPNTVERVKAANQIEHAVQLAATVAKLRAAPTVPVVTEDDALRRAVGDEDADDILASRDHHEEMMQLLPENLVHAFIKKHVCDGDAGEIEETIKSMTPDLLALISTKTATQAAPTVPVVTKAEIVAEIMKLVRPGPVLIQRKEKPTIAELEEILNSETQPKITINADGSVSEIVDAPPTTVGAVADAILSILSTKTAAQATPTDAEVVYADVRKILANHVTGRLNTACDEIMALIKSRPAAPSKAVDTSAANHERAAASRAMSDEELYAAVVAFVRAARNTSISFIQRSFQIGYNRAARTVERMEESGVVSAPSREDGKRSVLPTPPSEKA